MEIDQSSFCTIGGSNHLNEMIATGIGWNFNKHFKRSNVHLFQKYSRHLALSIKSHAVFTC